MTGEPAYRGVPILEDYTLSSGKMSLSAYRLAHNDVRVELYDFETGDSITIEQHEMEDIYLVIDRAIDGFWDATYDKEDGGLWPAIIITAVAVLALVAIIGTFIANGR